MGHPNAELIERFYAAFCRLDGDSMAACYAPGARFSDPVFIDLSDEQPGAMWKMLTGRAKDFTVQLSEHEASDSSGRAHWLADYTLSTGRRVHNDVRAEFRFEAGLIADHRDSWHTFDARNNTPRTGRVVVGRGRDAVDVALITSFGPLTLTGFEVRAERS
jgi:ketosteroid isomerase-like protein